MKRCHLQIEIVGSQISRPNLHHTPPNHDLVTHWFLCKPCQCALISHVKMPNSNMSEHWMVVLGFDHITYIRCRNHHYAQIYVPIKRTSRTYEPKLNIYLCYIYFGNFFNEWKEQRGLIFYGLGFSSSWIKAIICSYKKKGAIVVLFLKK